MRSKPEAPSSLIDTRAEKELIATAKTGDQLSFQMLFKRHQSRVFTLALRYTRIREDAEDIVQQTFQKAFRHLSRFEERSAFSTWLTRIAINESLMFLRRVRSLRELPIDNLNGYEEMENLDEPADTAPGPEAAYLLQERAQILTSALGRLRPGTRNVLELLELRQLSTAETARRVGISVGAVKARVFHGRRKLRSMLSGRSRLAQMTGSPVATITSNARRVLAQKSSGL